MFFAESSSDSSWLNSESPAVSVDLSISNAVDEAGGDAGERRLLGGCRLSAASTGRMDRLLSSARRGIPDAADFRGNTEALPLLTPLALDVAGSALDCSGFPCGTGFAPRAVEWEGAGMRVPSSRSDGDRCESSHSAGTRKRVGAWVSMVRAGAAGRGASGGWALEGRGPV